MSGPALSLLLAISGRKVALADLDGPGVAVLAGGSIGAEHRRRGATADRTGWLWAAHRGLS